MEVAGQLVQGGQNIFFAQLADPSTVHFSADATRYFSGEFFFMIFGLPGATNRNENSSGSVIPVIIHASAAKSDECMVVFTSLKEGEEIRMSKSGKVEKLEKTAEIVSLN